MDNPSNASNFSGGILVGKPWISWKLSFSQLISTGEIPAEKPQIENFLSGFLLSMPALSSNAQNLSFRYSWVASQADARLFTLLISVKNTAGVFQAPPPPQGSMSITNDGGGYTLDPKNNDRSTKNTVKISPPPTVSNQ